MADKPKLRRPFPRHYSDRKFWDRINRLNEKFPNNVAYGLGLALQDLESRLLNTVEDLEASVPVGAKLFTASIARPPR